MIYVYAKMSIRVDYEIISSIYVTCFWHIALSCSGGWQISGTPLDLYDPRVLAIAEAERQLLEAEYDDYNSTNATGAAFFRSAALIVRRHYN